MGARRLQFRLARGSADSVCLRARFYLHHAPTRPHTRPHTHTTPLHTTTLHSLVPPDHTSAPHSHLCFGCKMPVRHVPLGLASVFAKDRAKLPAPGTVTLLGFVSAAAKGSATPHLHKTHLINTHKHQTPTPIGKVYKRALVVPSSSPHQRAFVCGACTGTAQVGVSWVSSLDSLFKRSWLHCLQVCST